MERQPSLDRLPSSIQDTPQGISVVPQELIEEKNITTLREAVRNVPGISINAGEGGAQGDTLTIRGFWRAATCSSMAPAIRASTTATPSTSI